MFFFVHFFISFKYDFHVDTERMIVKVTAHSNNRNSKSTREVILGCVL